MRRLRVHNTAAGPTTAVLARAARLAAKGEVYRGRVSSFPLVQGLVPVLASTCAYFQQPPEREGGTELRGPIDCAFDESGWLGKTARMSQKLRDLIRSVRACKTAGDERAVIAKESALIRTAFKEENNE